MSTSTAENRILRLPAVLDRVGLKKSAFYVLVREGQFPKPVKLSERAVGWKSSDVVQWIESRAA